MRHFTPRRAWAPLSEAEWAALAPFVAHATAGPDSGPRRGPGRPLGTEARARMDAMCCTWR